jgi:hypothetical protein
MPSHEGRQSRLIPVVNELFQELPVAQPRSLLEKDRPAKMLNDPAYSARRHVTSLPNGLLGEPDCLLLPLVLPGQGWFVT